MNEIFRSAKLSAVILAIASSLLILMLLQRHMYEIWMQAETGRVFVNDRTYAMHQVLKHRNDTVPLVVFVGGSVTREATLTDEKVEKMYFDRFGQKQKFLNLGSSDQTLSESAAIINSLDLKSGSIVFIQFSFKKLDYSKADHHKEHRAPNMPFLNYSLTGKYLPYYEKLINNMTPDIILGRNFWHYFQQKRGCSRQQILSIVSSCYDTVPIVRSIYAEENRMSFEQKKEYVKNIENITFKKYHENYAFSATLVNGLVDFVKERGAVPVLIEYPIDRSEIDLYSLAKSGSIYQNIFESLNNKVIHIDMTKELSFVAEDFFDSQHMLPSGKQKSSELIINFAHDLLNKRKI